MLGAVIGDIVGSVHEFCAPKSKEFELLVAHSTYTDDSVLTVAVAHWLMRGGNLVDFLHRYVADHPGRGYGGWFGEWIQAGRREPYNSFGNGSAMRVSPVGFAFDTLDETLAAAERSAAVTHDHPEGIRGARATAAAAFLARRIKDRNELRRRLEELTGYDLGTPLAEIRPSYRFDETCQATVPPALRCVLESTDYEDALRNAVSLGGDADTLACIAGGVAEALYDGLPEELVIRTRPLIDPRLLVVIDEFRTRYHLGHGRP